MSAQFEAHLRELAEIADLAQRDPQEALDRSLIIKFQPGARELHVAVVLYCQFQLRIRQEIEEAGGSWNDFSEGGAV